MDNPFASRCDSCNHLRRNLSVQLVRFNKQVNSIGGISSSSKINKRFLSEEEKNQRDHDQKRRRINAEKRAQYWRIRACEEKKFKQRVKEDGDDMMAIFTELDSDSKTEEVFANNPKMAMFWEMQREVVKKKDQKTSIRWRPE